MHWAGEKAELVSASQDGKLIIWNAISTNKVNAIPLRSSWVMTCAYEGSKGELVACGGLDNRCSVYKVDKESTGSSRATLELSAHDGYLSCCRFPSPREIVTSSGDSTCILWDLESSEVKVNFNDHAGDVMSVAISPSNPHTFVSGSCDSYAKLWDCRQQKSVATFRGHESDINSVSFFPDGNSFGTGSDDSSCRHFDLRCMCEINQFGSDKILCGITSVAFSSSGRFLIAGYDDYKVYCWDTTSPPEQNPTQEMSQHDNRVSCLGVNSSGEALCTGSWDTLLKVWA